MNPLRVAARSRDDFHIYYIYAYNPVIEAYGMEHKLYQMQKQIELQSLEIRNWWYLQEKKMQQVFSWTIATHFSCTNWKHVAHSEW